MENLQILFLFYISFPIMLFLGWRLQGKQTFRPSYELIMAQLVACVCMCAGLVSHHPRQPIEVSGSIIKACHWPEPESGQPIRVTGARSQWGCDGDSFEKQKRQLWPSTINVVFCCVSLPQFVCARWRVWAGKQLPQQLF